MHYQSSLNGAAVAGSTTGKRAKASLDQAVARDTNESSTNNSSSAKAAGGKKPGTFGKFTKLAREKGIGYAIYLYVFGEAISILITYLLHYDILGAGDVMSWLSYIGLGSWVDIDKAGSKHTTIFGYEVSVRLLTNYGIANVVGIPLFPLEVAFCAFTFPFVLRATRRLKFWKSANNIPKAPQASGAAASASTQQLPK